MTLNRSIELTADEVKAAVAKYISENIDDCVLEDCHTAYDMEFHGDGSMTCKCKEAISV